MGDVQELLVEVTPSTTIISGLDALNITTRTGHFLLPRAEQANPPKLPPAPKIPSPIPITDLQVKFDKSWSGSPELWRKWMTKLRPMHEPMWRELGILDGLVTTTCRFKRDETLLVELAMFWSAETNTFIFPWGEATVTLEDMAVLGGLPLLGGSGRDKPSPEVQEDAKELERHRTLLNQSKYKKPTYSGWVKHFLECVPEDGTGEQVEHAAFLAMWLSMFVLKAPPFDVVQADVFMIAARMVHGQSVALAPAAVASLYRDLSTLKCHLSSRKEETYMMRAPLNVLQLWVWERFPALRPEIVSSLDGHHFPRAARWDNVQTRLDPSTVREELESPTQFEWMPYRSRNLARLHERGWVSGDDIVRSKELQSYARCIHACDLIGMHCTEMYRPHRVARQLGFDQDVPGTVARIRSSCKEAWKRYDLKPESITFFIPYSEPGTTANYMHWWKKYYSATSVSKKKRVAIAIQEGTNTCADACIKRHGKVRTNGKSLTLEVVIL
ncbi:protein MAIN-LIKE 2-like [Phragmites australis]|uniref:protein MAIN-LIKE 2-like n=1 Tax=Phragmites australis TaxID=29695 RepID=UPI002D780CBA|nr:protein MAIN-LIKE 2-like [Phragmites australis]